MKCVNCDNDAAYLYDPSESSSIPYCIRCLPSFLVPRMKAGHLRNASDFKVVLNSALEALPASEPTPEPEPEKAPAKKVSKKAAAVEPDAK
jgi:hypothetical protein